MWGASEVVLSRMDEVLQGLGFDVEHKGRKLMKEISLNNTVKKNQQILISQVNGNYTPLS